MAAFLRRQTCATVATSTPAARDWHILLGSGAISNIYWILTAYMGISVMEWVWKAVKSGVL